MKKIVIGICSVHRDISSKTNNLKIFKFLLSKKLVLGLGSILAQNSTFNFDDVWGKNGLQSLLLHQALLNFTTKLYFSPLVHENMDLVLHHNHRFPRILQLFKICQCLSLHFVIKCALNNRIRDNLCVQYKMNPF